MKKVLPLLLLLTACNTPAAPVATTSTITTEAPIQGEPGPMGPAGADGATGPQGTIGPQGVAGHSAPVFRLHDLNNVALPGIFIGAGMIFNEDENKVATYACATAAGCHMKPVLSFYFGNGCTGNPFVNTTIQNVVFKVRNVLWTPDTSQVITNQSVGSLMDEDGNCGSTISGSVHTFYLAVPYTGVLPASPPGPYTIVKE